MEINEKLEEELNKLFPKGNKARGKALVLNAIANIEIDKAKEEIKIIQEYCKKHIYKGTLTDFYKGCNKAMEDIIDLIKTGQYKK